MECEEVTDVPEAFSFAALCRCGKTACASHETGADDGKVLLQPTTEPLRYKVDLRTKVDETHAFDGTVSAPRSPSRCSPPSLSATRPVGR